MKKTIAITTLLLITLVGISESKPRGNVGLGIIVGEPTGVDLKVFLSEVNAIEGAIAWSLSGDNEFHLQVDYLYHFYDWIKVEKGLLPVFMGIGGRIALRDNDDDLLGIRIPFGLAYEFADGIFDVFGQIVPVLNLTPDTDFDLEGAIGGRFWF
jgi:hypothetical protein